MKISLNDIRYYQQVYNWSADPAPNGVAELVEKIGSQLGAVEEVIDFGSKYNSVIVARIVSCVDHENSDHLHVCMLDDGGVVEGVERDSNGHVQIVCGAPNARQGITVAWLPPGSTVPETADSDDPFVLSARPLRGVVSNGMLASPRELALGESHEGILEMSDDVAPGTSFAKAFNLVGDSIIDIENKMFTHRPDCFGVMGVAREIAGIYHQPFTSPDWYSIDAAIPAAETEALPLEIRNELPVEVPRFMAITLRDVQIGPSPLWLQIFLAKMGVKAINNIVDYTNYYMFLTGQPLHAYDYDKVMAQDTDADRATLVIRNPKPSESVKLLNGKTIEPRPQAIMIATNDKLIGVGGVMGGSETEVDGNTRNIILECATFDMYSIRRTSMAHGLFTDAVTRNNKGQSPLQNRAVLAKIVDEIRQVAGGKVASDVLDDNHVDTLAMQRSSLYQPVTVSRAFINTRLGLELSTQQMQLLLQNVEFTVTVEGDDLTVAAPFWRTDIEIPEDVVEEIGRLYGFDQLPLALPKRDITPTHKDALLELKRQIRDVLSNAGANEVLTYSFVHGKLLQKVGQDPEQAFKLSNALSPDLQYYRLSVTPSLLDKVHPNIKAGYDRFVLFEMNKTHDVRQATSDHGLPSESEMLSLVFAANDKKVDPHEGAALYQARIYLDALAKQLGITLEYDAISEKPTDPVAQPYDHRRSALVLDQKTNTPLGVIGEFSAGVRKQFKLPVHSAGFEIDLRQILQARSTTSGYIVQSKYPKLEQDISLRVPVSVGYQQLYDFIGIELEKMQETDSFIKVQPIDIYVPADQQDYKHMTFRVSATHYNKTMQDAEVSALLANVAQAAKVAFDAEVL
jgi:phenylalanyl-tRNA synthetase beta chain